MDEKLHRFHLIVLLISTAVYLVTAMYSLGYYYFDEQYQILEFANLKLGLSNAEDLAWEYSARIRPATQPAIYMVLYEMASLLGLKDPYSITFLSRVLSMVLSLFAIRIFVLAFIESITPQYRKLYIVCSYLLWFLPFLNVRFASETWSGIFLMLATAMVMRAKPNASKDFLLAGLFMGLSFVFRFQTAFALAGILGYAYFVARQSFSKILMMVGSAALCIAIATLVDFWYYEEFSFSAWNYFIINIIEDVASSFGTSPWYFYFSQILLKAILPFGLLILVCSVLTILKRPKHIVVWIMVPFIVLHMIVPHKELRFLFPLINFVPIIMVIGMEELGKISPKFFIRQQLVVYTFGTCVLMINLLCLTMMAFRPMGNGAKALTSFIYHSHPEKRVSVICEQGFDIFNPLGRVRENTYYDPRVNIIQAGQLAEEASKINVKAPIYFICSKDSFDFPNNQEIIDKYGLELKTQSIPGWIEMISDWHGKRKKNEVLLLYGKD